MATLWTRPRDELIRFFINRNINPYLKNAVQRDAFDAKFQVGSASVRFERLDLDENVCFEFYIDEFSCELCKILSFIQ